MSEADAIREFWRYWSENGDAIGQSIPERTLQRFVEPLGKLVSAIDPRLDWEFGKGRVAQHYFCLAPKGDARLRVVTERWRSQGLPDGSVFEFHPIRPGGGYIETSALDFGVAQFAFSDFRVSLTNDEAREVVDVAIHHPSFAGAEEKLRSTATFVMLDAMLGEDDVERFVGQVSFLDEAPTDGVTLAALVDRIAALRADATGERFVLAKGTAPSGAPLFATINRALKRIDHLGFDTYFEVVVPILRPTDAGLPTDEEAGELNALEDALFGDLGRDAAYLGRLTSEARRTLMLFSSATGPGAAAIDAFVRRHAERGVEVAATDDPQWDSARGW